MNTLVIVDVETTGLVRERAHLLEVACIVLTDQLQEVGRFSRVLLDVKGVPGDDPSLEEGAMKMHERTGLIDDIVNNRGTSIEVATGDMIRMLAAAGCNVEPTIGKFSGDLIMIGNNPDFDRMFLLRCMPHIGQLFHYRTINVSSLREVFARAAGLTVDRLKMAISEKKDSQHRAMADCENTMREFTRYAMCCNGQALVAGLQAEGRM